MNFITKFDIDEFSTDLAKDYDTSYSAGYESWMCSSRASSRPRWTMGACTVAAVAEPVRFACTMLSGVHFAMCV